jgi:hypothetical protein
VPIELPPPPPHINLPAFSYTPPTHSYGTGMVTTSTTAVNASSFAGGYPDVERPRIEDMSETEYRNVLRLICLVWGFNDVKVVDSILQLEKPKCNHAGFLSKQFSTRFAAQKSNHINDMVREAVEVHDLIATLRNVARVSVLCKVTALAESPEQQARHKRMSDEYKTEVYSIRDRALARLDQRMGEVEGGIPGAIQVKRLRGIRDRAGSDPFVGLEVDLEAGEVEEEPVYWELEMEARKQFWLERYDENIVAWYWEFRGVIDICETVSSEPFRIFFQARVCSHLRRHVHVDHQHEHHQRPESPTRKHLRAHCQRQRNYQSRPEGLPRRCW